MFLFILTGKMKLGQFFNLKDLAQLFKSTFQGWLYYALFL
jgi:hypothetical protein